MDFFRWFYSLDTNFSSKCKRQSRISTIMRSLTAHSSMTASMATTLNMRMSKEQNSSKTSSKTISATSLRVLQAKRRCNRFLTTRVSSTKKKHLKLGKISTSQQPIKINSKTTLTGLLVVSVTTSMRRRVFGLHLSYTVQMASINCQFLFLSRLSRMNLKVMRK